MSLVMRSALTRSIVPSTGALLEQSAPDSRIAEVEMPRVGDVNAIVRASAGTVNGVARTGRPGRAEQTSGTSVFSGLSIIVPYCGILSRFSPEGARRVDPLYL